MAEAESVKRYNSILEIIDKRLIPDDEAKKLRGEVFTPLDLVRQMLFGLRKTSIKSNQEPEIWGINKEGDFFDEDEDNRIGGVPLSVWRDSKSKWLDPANGIGNFPVTAFYMLDYQLGKYGNDTGLRGDENKNKRRKWIIENMLYMIELNKGNVNTTKKIFNKIHESAKPNICCANTLEMTDDNLREKFGVNRFDVVMGNPPFNSGGTHQKGSTIWPSFILKYPSKEKKIGEAFPGGLQILKENGSLIYVIPQGWRTPSYGEILKEFKKNYIKTVKILSGAHFPLINMPLDYFNVQLRNSHTDKTDLINEELSIYDQVSIGNMDIIPNYGWDIFKRWDIEKLERLNVQRSSTHVPSTKKGIFQNHKDSEFRYPIIKKINSDGPEKIYSSVKHDVQDKIKVLLAFGAYLYPTIDNGECGVSENVLFIVCDNLGNAEKVKKYLENPFVICLINSLKVGGYAPSNKLLSYLPDPLKFVKSLNESLLLKTKDDKLLRICDNKRRGKTNKANKLTGGRKKNNKTYKKRS
jgi:hypothetical protein